MNRTKQVFFKINQCIRIPVDKHILEAQFMTRLKEIRVEVAYLRYVLVRVHACQISCGMTYRSK